MAINRFLMTWKNSAGQDRSRQYSAPDCSLEAPVAAGQETLRVFLTNEINRDMAFEGVLPGSLTFTQEA